MSSFTYLIPLDWDTFTQDLLPAWKYLLDTPSTLPTFVQSYLPPDHDERFLVDWDRALWASFPPGYCDALGWNPMHPILTTAAVRLHGESTRAARIPAMYPASEVLCAAIAQYARLDVGQPDPLRHRMHPFMCHPLDYPDLQAVGDNQGLRDVLALVFEPRYHRAGYTSYRPHAAASRRLIDATAQLMLGMRTLPGLLMPPQPLSQPGWDDPTLCGYLTPDELAAWQEALLPILEAVPGQSEPDWSLLLRDRLGRTVAHGGGMVTISGW